LPQRSDGSWWGRWGVSYLYGTFSALSGLRAIGADMSEPWIAHAVTWLKSVQNADGGWGETCLADRDPSLKGKGTSTPSQTAWGLIGLIAGVDEISDSAMRGVAWLLEQQNSDGRWEDTEFTGTGFPNHFYLRYHMYAHYFPLMALGRFRQRMGERASH
jgi:squalene-hopene/tetraprenyl-beta-curcumene cyclase